MINPDTFSDFAERDRGRMNGLVVGIVICNKDPQKLGRVQVTFPGCHDEEIGHWARVASIMAGPQRGVFFLPEEKDEVLIAFESGDVTCPYVLGTLWNSKDKPPEVNADGQNNLRFIRSRSGHLLRFDDSKDAEKIEIIDKSGKNSITIDTANNTITITSAKDITIKAKDGAIKLEAKNVEISSTAEAKVQAKGLTLDGKSGDTTITGKTVKIN